MKKSLLTLVSVMLTTMSALALPTKPEITFSAWASGQTVYLYNVDAGLFLTGGNYWGTRAAVVYNGSKDGGNYVSYERFLVGDAKANGYKFEIGEEENQTVGEETVACYSFANKTTSNYLTADNADGIWVDGGTGRPYNKWYVKNLDNNTFQLNYVDMGMYGLQNFDKGDTNTFLDKENNAYTTWAIVSEAVYEAVIDQLNLYYIAQGLNNLVTDGKGLGIEKDWTAYDAILANDASTYDEYKDAAQGLYPIVNLGKSIAEAKALDATHNWTEFETLFANAETTEEEAATALANINSFIALKKGLTAEDIDADHDYSSFETIYNDAKSTTAVLDSALTNLNAYKSLKAKIDAAKADYPSLDISSVEAVYNATMKKNAELADAEKALQALITEYELSFASLDHPANITSQISGIDGTSITDWKRVFIGNGSTGSLSCNTWSTEATEDGMVTPFIENWVSAGGTLSDQKVYRDTVTVKPGAYKITVKGRLFNESAGATYLKGANVFANINRKSITKEGIEDPENAIDGAKYADFNGKLYYYKDDFEGYGVVGSDGKLIFGMYIKDANCNWLAHKNYQVYYLGDSFESLDYVRQNTNLLADAYDEEVVAQKSLVGEYNAAVASYNAATDAASIISASAKIAELQDSVANNIAAYKAYTDRLDFISNYMGNEGATLEGPEVDLLTDYLDGDEGPCDEYPNGYSHYILDQLTLNTPEIKAELEFLNQLFNSALENGMSEGTDVTNLLVNPSFADGFNGWTSSTGGEVKGNIDRTWKDVELFGSTNQAPVDCQQTVKAKPGIYAISVKAFERPGGNTTYDGSEKVKTSIFMNKFKTPVKHIVVDALDPDLAEDKVNCMLSNDYKFTNEDLGMTEWLVPNSMEGARYAFNAERYVNTCYGLVEDGEDMTIGITSDGVIPHWVIWAEFKLTYMGKNADAVAAVLEAKLDEYSAYVDEQKDNELINSKEQDLADDAIDNAEGALQSGDADKMWDALIAINDAYTHTQEHVAIMTELLNDIDNLSDAVNEYGETASAAAVNKANEILGTDYDELTNEELSALSASAKDAIAELKIPATQDASDDNHIDFTSVIINPGFEEGFNTGWKNTHNGGNAQILSSGIEKQSAEFWNGTAANLKFNIWQDIALLPAGKYELTADASNCLVGNSTNNPDALGRAFLYAGTFTSESDTTYFSSDPVVLQEEQCTEKWNNYSVIFTVNEGETVAIGFQTSGTMAAGWFVCDNFTLKYFGTESQHEDSENPMSVDGIEVAEGAQIVAIYTVSGAPVATLQKGLNIVKYADGSVKKIFVK